MRFCWLVSAVAMGLLGASSARAAQYWVDQNAAAGGDGSLSKPFQTINAGKAVLTRGDTLWIRNGTYGETVNFWKLPGTTGRTYVRADSGQTPIIDGGGTSGYVIQSGTPEMTFEGLTVRNGADGFEFYQSQADGGQVIGCKTEQITGNAVEFYYSSQGYVLQSDLQGSVTGKRTDGTILESNRIHNSSHEGITLHDQSTNCQYLHNVVYDNVSVNIYLDSCSSMLVDGNFVYMTNAPAAELAGIQMADEYYSDLSTPVLNDITIANNVIFNTYYGIVFWLDQTGSGMKNVTIENNTIANSARIGFIWDLGAHQNTVVRNNVFANVSGGTYALNAKSTTGVTLDHNLWSFPGIAQPFNWGGGTTYDHAGWVTASGQGAGDVLADPKFAGAYSATATNLALAAGSPAIDTGTSVTLDHDYLGNARPFGSAFDIGAFEFGAPPAPDGGVKPPPPSSDGGTGGSTDSGGGNADGGGGGGGSSGCSCDVGGLPSNTSAALYACIALFVFGWRRQEP